MTKNRTRLDHVTDSTWDIFEVRTGKIGFVRRCDNGKFLGRIGDAVVRECSNEQEAYRNVLAASGR